ncbi:MAG: cytochrome ubiquinol oxidase subunit I [Deltaproteobacteria bacterium]|nr:cytochrome ubiquinol oxidase subunit I [Candidatus Anaeroferrophillacea bacterium]
MLQSIPLFGMAGGLLPFCLVFVVGLNLAIGTPIVALIAERKAVGGDERDLGILARHLIRSALPIIIIGMIAGLPILFSLGGYFSPFFVRILAPFWLVGTIGGLLLLAAIGGLWLFYLTGGPAGSGKRRSWHFIIGLCASLFALAFLFFGQLLPSFLLTPSAGFLENGSTSAWEVVFNPTLIPAFVHSAVGTLAITGLLAMVITAQAKEGRRLQPREYYKKAFMYGGWWALNATVIQIIPGVWTYVSLPAVTKDALLGGPVAGWFVAALGCTFIGVLLLLKLLRDGLVNRRATMIVAFILLAGTLLMHVTTMCINHPATLQAARATAGGPSSPQPAGIPGAE